MVERGTLTRIHGLSAVANLSTDIAERQKRRALQRLQPQFPNVRIKIEQLPSKYKGTVLLLMAEYGSRNGYAQCCFYSLGQLGKPAERVADEAVDAFLNFDSTGAAVDQYLADQLLLPLALASGKSEIHTSQITPHLLTNIEIIRLYLPSKIEIIGEAGQPGIVHITPYQRI
jgi:RNA 3'-terminal phosphate cyclase (ATP)